MFSGGQNTGSINGAATGLPATGAQTETELGLDTEPVDAPESLEPANTGNAETFQVRFAQRLAVTVPRFDALRPPQDREDIYAHIRPPYHSKTPKFGIAFPWPEESHHTTRVLMRKIPPRSNSSYFDPASPYPHILGFLSKEDIRVLYALKFSDIILQTGCWQQCLGCAERLERSGRATFMAWDNLVNFVRELLRIKRETGFTLYDGLFDLHQWGDFAHYRSVDSSGNLRTIYDVVKLLNNELGVKIIGTSSGWSKPAYAAQAMQRLIADAKDRKIKLEITLSVKPFTKKFVQEYDRFLKNELAAIFQMSQEEIEREYGSAIYQKYLAIKDSPFDPDNLSEDGADAQFVDAVVEETFGKFLGQSKYVREIVDNMRELRDLDPQLVSFFVNYLAEREHIPIRLRRFDGFFRKNLVGKLFRLCVRQSETLHIAREDHPLAGIGGAVEDFGMPQYHYSYPLSDLTKNTLFDTMPPADWWADVTLFLYNGLRRVRSQRITAKIRATKKFLGGVGPKDRSLNSFQFSVSIETNGAISVSRKPSKASLSRYTFNREELLSASRHYASQADAAALDMPLRANMNRVARVFEILAGLSGRNIFRSPVTE